MNKKRILYLLLSFVLIGSCVAYYLWNKPHEKVEDISGVSVTAEVLCKAFADNEAEANKQYSGKALEVKGLVIDTKNNQDGKLVITMQGSDADLSVQCTMRDAATTAAKGQTIVVKGFFASNDMFGPTLTDCVLLKSN